MSPPVATSSQQQSSSRTSAKGSIAGPPVESTAALESDGRPSTAASIAPTMARLALPVKGGLTAQFWRDRIFVRFFDPAKDRADRKSLYAALRCSRAMFAAAAGGLYHAPPLAGLSYEGSKAVFLRAILKSESSKRPEQGRHYGAMVRVLDLAGALPAFVDKKVSDVNMHSIAQKCPNLTKIVLPYSRRAIDVASKYGKAKSDPKGPLPSVHAQLASSSSKSGSPTSSTTTVASQPADISGLTDRTLWSLARVAAAPGGKFSALHVTNIHDFTVGGFTRLMEAASSTLTDLTMQERYAPAGSTLGTDIVSVLVSAQVTRTLRSLKLIEIPVAPIVWSGFLAASAVGRNLTVLHLAEVEATSDVVAPIVDVAPYLHQLHVSARPGPTIAGDKDWVPLMSALGLQLRSLALTSVPVTDASLKCLVGRTPKLRHLEITDAELSDPMVLAAVIGPLPTVSWIDVSANRRLQQNPRWALVYNKSFETGSAADPDTGDEPWWMEESDEQSMTFGFRKHAEVRAAWLARQ
ncbi:hypothetical protein BC828DRAFT_387464 [Blastocladiella britannica]|nr:hypothetical protein BC828DRAFT_387464 [Blastocladiella britannica]